MLFQSNKSCQHVVPLSMLSMLCFCLSSLCPCSSATYCIGQQLFTFCIIHYLCQQHSSHTIATTILTLQHSSHNTHSSASQPVMMSSWPLCNLLMKLCVLMLLINGMCC